MNNRYKDYTELDLIREAQEVQNACNLSGVVHSFSAAVSRLWEIYNQRRKQNENFIFSTKDINQHQVCRLFASKIISLSGEPELHDFE